MYTSGLFFIIVGVHGDIRLMGEGGAITRYRRRGVALPLVLLGNIARLLVIVVEEVITDLEGTHSRLCERRQELLLLGLANSAHLAYGLDASWDLQSRGVSFIALGPLIAVVGISCFVTHYVVLLEEVLDNKLIFLEPLVLESFFGAWSDLGVGLKHPL